MVAGDHCSVFLFTNIFDLRFFIISYLIPSLYYIIII